LEFELTNLLKTARFFVFAATMAAVAVPAAMAQFTGPSPEPRTTSVKQALQARPNTYVTVTGRIVNHLRQDYYMFRDASGEIRVEIGSSVWQNRKIGPDTKVRLQAEVDRSPAGPYLWVKSLEVLE